MNEAPDFETLARQIHRLIAPLPRSVGEQEIVEQLRLVWNARGAADIAKVELLDEAPAAMTTSAIKALDR